MKKFFLVALVVLVLVLGSSLPVGASSSVATVSDAVTAVRPALLIKAPGSAQTGDPVIITVYEIKSNVPVSGAGVWALVSNNMPVTTSNRDDITSYVAKYGIFFGKTDNQGQVTGKFEKPGIYVLVAVKDGYLPGFAKISIYDFKALVIRAPAVVKVLEPFSLRVVEKTVLTVEIPVPKASVWAVDLTTASVLDGNTDLAAVTQKHGIHLGYTDEKGYLQPEPVLKRAGTYWLVALKDGYAPAITRIIVKAPVTATPIPLKQMAKPSINTTAKVINSAKLNLNWVQNVPSIYNILEILSGKFPIVNATPVAK